MVLFIYLFLAVLKESKEKESNKRIGEKKKSSAPLTGKRGEKQSNFEEGNVNADRNKWLQRS